MAGGREEMEMSGWGNKRRKKRKWLWAGPRLKEEIKEKEEKGREGRKWAQARCWKKRKRK